MRVIYLALAFLSALLLIGSQHEEPAKRKQVFDERIYEEKYLECRSTLPRDDEAEMICKERARVAAERIPQREFDFVGS